MIRKLFRVLPLIVILTSSLTCNLPIQPTATDTPTQTKITPTIWIPTPTATQQPPLGVFTLVVLVDLNSEPVTRDQAQIIVDEASQILSGLTGFTFEMVDYREIRNTTNLDHVISDYLNSKPAVIPNGYLIFSYGDGNRAKTYGGYSVTHKVSNLFKNAFESPYIPAGNIYGAIVHYSHKFSRCGYGDSDTPVSTVSIDGECRNQQGTACTEKYGYQMCTTAVDDLYASTPTYFTSASLVHEIMHPFGSHGNYDHYASPDCNEEMMQGISQRPYNTGEFDKFEADSYVVMCPYVFDVFINSYHP